MKSILRSTLMLILALLPGCVSAQAAVRERASKLESTITTFKSVFTLTTFKKDGSLIASSRGVFVSPNGWAVSTWAPFVGADSAVVIDAAGKKYEVQTIGGASEVYDICRFKISAKTIAAKYAESKLPVGAKAWIVEYVTGKPKLVPLKVTKAETFDNSYNYYSYEGEAQAMHVGCPVVNERGEVLGILQQSQVSSEFSSTDARFAETLKTTGLSVNDPILKQTSIRLALPYDSEQATLMLMLTAGQNDAERYLKTAADFTLRFPTAIEGYTAMAETMVAKREFAEADKIMQTAITMAAKKDEAHHALAKLIYKVATSADSSAYAPWTINRALTEAEQAYTINPLPIYRHLQAQITYFRGEYQKAFAMLIALTNTPLRNGELFYEAAQCKQQLKAPFTEVVALLDSAVTAQPINLSAPYLLARATAFHDAKEYRRAVADYNRYDSLMQGNATHDFYYARYLCEVQLRQFQQALNDIAHAIVLNRNEPTYYAELAQLQLRVNQLDDALQTIEMAMEIAPNYPDLYIIKGLVLINKNQKKDGLEQFDKAKELGDERAAPLIEKYK